LLVALGRRELLMIVRQGIELHDDKVLFPVLFAIVYRGLSPAGARAYDVRCIICHLSVQPWRFVNLLNIVPPVLAPPRLVSAETSTH